jgi:hypothetical protein
VSFDRPYDRAGIDRFLSYEQPAVALAERLGLRLAYITDTDLRQPTGDPARSPGADHPGPFRVLEPRNADGRHQGT